MGEREGGGGRGRGGEGGREDAYGRWVREEQRGGERERGGGGKMGERERERERERDTEREREIKGEFHSSNTEEEIAAHLARGTKLHAFPPTQATTAPAAA